MNETQETASICPQCNYENSSIIQQEVIYFDSSYERLLIGDLNTLMCFQCHNEYRIETPLYCYLEEYHTLIFYHADFAQLETKTLEIVFEELLQSSIEIENKDSLQTRICFTREEFIEKIHIIAHSLNDYIIEYLKFQVIKKENYKLENVQLFYDYSNKDEKKHCFLVLEKGKEEIKTRLELNSDAYHEIMDKFSNNTLDLQNIFEQYYISIKRFKNI